MHKGSCLCGAIAYEIDGELTELGNCHCHMCQKAHGAAFGTYVMVKWDEFRLLHGDAEIGKYRSSDVITRSFCRQCGSTLQFIRDGAQSFGLAAGTLDTDPQLMASYEIWTESRARWCELGEDAQSYAQQP